MYPFRHENLRERYQFMNMTTHCYNMYNHAYTTITIETENKHKYWEWKIFRSSKNSSSEQECALKNKHWEK